MRKRTVTRGNFVVEPLRVIKVGNSHYVSLPAEFLAAHKIKAGDWVPVVATHILQIVLISEHQQTRKKRGNCERMG